MDERREYMFAELIRRNLLEIGDGYRAKNSELGGNGPIFLRAGHVRDTHIDFNGVERFHSGLASTVKSKMSRPEDVIVTTKGNSTGRTSYVERGMPPFVYSPHLSYWRSCNTQTIVPGYLRYWSRSRYFREQLAGLAGSTDMAPYLSLVDQKRLRIVLPSVDKQLAFAPVRAKAEGGELGLPKPIADLFPDSFEDSELGEIPTGWEVRGIDEIARFLNGLALQKYPPKHGRSLPVIKIAQLRAGSTTGADAASADLDADYVVGNGDVLFSWSGSLMCELWTAGRGALNQHLFKVTSAHFPKWFYYLWIHQHLDDFRHIAAGKATTMGHIQRHHLSDAKVVVPDRATLKMASHALSPLIERIIATRIDSRTLSALRDTLLPKLISGELQVKDVERRIENVQ